MKTQKVKLTIEISPIENKLILTACDEKQNCSRVMSDNFSYWLRRNEPLQDVLEKQMTFSFVTLVPLITKMLLNEDLEELE